MADPVTQRTLLTRRTMFLGLSGLLATPAIVRSTSLMRLNRSVALVAPWYTPAGLLKSRAWVAEQIAREIIGVQPIDPKPFLDLYNALRPTPEFPHGQTLVFVHRPTSESISNA